ncbi:MAG: hypothetical protein ACRCVX_02160 [Shewanella sp.]
MLKHTEDAIIAHDIESLFGISKTFTSTRKVESVSVDGYPISFDRYLRLAYKLAGGKVWFDKAKREFLHAGLDPLIASEIIAAMKKLGVGDDLQSV